MHWLLLVIIALLTAIVVSHTRLSRRVLEFLRSEDLAQREILGRLIEVMTEHARKRGHVEVRLSGLQKEVNRLGQLTAQLSERMASGSHPVSGVRGPVAKHAKVECIPGPVIINSDGEEPGTSEQHSEHRASGGRV